MAESHVLVVGGGLAGLSTAVALVDRGYRVTVLEARPRLGGRASSVVDAVTGEAIDNCQHVSMGCCVNFQQLCRQTDTGNLFVVEDQLNFLARDGRINRFRNGLGPAPLHLTASFAQLSYFTWREKAALARAVRRLMRAQPPASGRFSDWLDQQGQSTRLKERFWNIVLVSALSERLDRIDFAHGRKVFLDGFLQHRDAWKVHLLTVPLGEFYDQHLAAWLKQKGATVECKAGVQELRISAERRSPSVDGVLLRDGSFRTADHYVLAAPWDRVGSLLPAELREQPRWKNLNQLESAAITSVHFWTDRPLTPLRHAVLIDRLGQWMFNRSAILNDPAQNEASSRFAYQVVISNSRDKEQESLSQQELIDWVWSELQEIWPAAQVAKRLHARAITEHKAVFSPVPGVESLRPTQTTAVSNLFLAGDFTQTGWPATMEGAVRSGFLAAGHILQQDGNVSNPQELLAAELQPSRLMRWLADVDRPL